jgi:hypothetical protein
MFYSIGYVELDTCLMLAAGLGIAEAISTKRVDKRFAGEVMDDETVGSTQDENTEHNSNQLSSITEGREEPENKKKLIRLKISKKLITFTSIRANLI